MPSGQLIGLSPGVATITYTLPTGCYITTGVVVNAIPTASTITGSRILCVGQTSTLVSPAPFTGGSWTSFDPSIASIVLSTGLMTGVSPGTTTITYTMPTGCDTFFTVTVNANPTAITGVLAVCVGNSTTLSSTPPGGTWSSSNPASGTINATTGVFTGIAAALSPLPFGPSFTTITYVAPGTGCTVSAQATVNPIPNAIVGNNQICLGDTSLFRVIGSPGGGWSSSNTGVATVTAISSTFDSAIVIGTGIGTASITYTLPTGCFTVLNVTVHPLPNPINGPDTVCVGATIALTSVPLVPPAGGGIWISGNVAVATVGSLSGIVTGVSPGTAVITYAISPAGCFETKIVSVRPNPAAIVVPTNVCVGFTVTATNPTVGGTWVSSDDAIATVGSATGIITGVSPGAVTITYRMAVTQCFVTAVVNVQPIPDVTIVTYPTIVCKYASVTVTATGAGGGGTYSWAPLTGLSSGVGATVVASPTITTTYTVTGTTIYGCSDTAIVTVFIDSMLNDIKIVGNDSICLGSCTTLMASGREGTFFNWKPAVGLSCTICDTTTACPVVTPVSKDGNFIIYTAVAIDSMGCRDSVSFRVTIMPLPLMKVLPNPAIVCNGSSTQLLVSDSFATSGSTRFGWAPNVFISCDTCPNPVVSTTFNLVYKVTGVTPFGCYDSLRVPVTVLDSAFNSINRDTVICEGQSAQLRAISENPDGSRSDFRWSPNIAISNIYVSNPVVNPLVTTTYRVIITPNVCWPDTLYTTVVVAPYPEIQITTEPKDLTVAPGTQVHLTATILNEMIIRGFAWTPPATLSCDSCYRTVATPLVNTTYTFTATSIYGCQSTKEVTITTQCENGEVFIPNTFTPNGDGMNDRFYVSATGIEKVTKMMIYNRWGELVYERYNIQANDPSVGWDGQFKGIVLTPDVFYYYIEAICNLGDVFSYKGDVTIVR